MSSKISSFLGCFCISTNESGQYGVSITCHPPFSAVGTEAVGDLGAGSAAEIGNTKATANERAVRRSAMKEKIGWATRFETRRKNQRVFFMGRCLNLWGD